MGSEGERDLRRWEQGIVVQLDGVDVAPNAEHALRLSYVEAVLGRVIDDFAERISLAVHELYPDARIIQRGEVSAATPKPVVEEENR